MPSDYPGSIDSWSAFGANMDDFPLHEDVHTDVQDAITAIQTELGVNPAGSASDVATRLASFGVNSGVIVPFTSSGSFVKASYPWAFYVVVHVIGGGGGGGGTGLTDANERAEGGGGGGGGYAVKRIAVGDLAASETVTVGAGGAAGTGFVTTPTTGGTGGTSSFGSHCSATGGTGGGGMAGTEVTLFAARGTGGTGSGGDINLQGDDGGGGLVIDTHNSLYPLSQNHGGAAAGPFSATRRNGPSVSTFTGVVGKSYGGGGTGGRANVSETPNGPAGGAGAAGAVFVEVL